nr:hypothetical transcript [Hymenolepis microstoma]
MEEIGQVVHCQTSNSRGHGDFAGVNEAMLDSQPQPDDVNKDILGNRPLKLAYNTLLITFDSSLIFDAFVTDAYASPETLANSAMGITAARDNYGISRALPFPECSSALMGFSGSATSQLQLFLPTWEKFFYTLIP